MADKPTLKIVKHQDRNPSEEQIRITSSIGSSFWRAMKREESEKTEEEQKGQQPSPKPPSASSR